MIDAEYDQVDDGILAALYPAIVQLEDQVATEGSDPMVLWSVVVVGYLDENGEEQIGYRRVKSNWFHVAGASKLLSIAYQRAWDVDD